MIPVDMDAWRRLYAAADLVKKLSPWDWMEETDVFGVQFPGTDEVGYISVMGCMGEHFAVSAYLGDEAANTFFDIEDSSETGESSMHILEARQLMASFEDRDMLEKQDRDIIKGLGLQYRGRSNWPLFRSYRPGFFPWFLEAEEVAKLTIALEQVAGLAMRIEDDPSVLDMGDERDFLVRVLRGTGNATRWEDTVRRLPPQHPFTLEFHVNHNDFETFKSLPRDKRAVEMSLSLSPARVGGPGDRPMLVYLLLVVEPESFFVLGMELMQATDGLHQMWAEIPGKFVSILNKAQMQPCEVRVASRRLYQMMSPLLNDIGIELSLSRRLPAVEDAMESLRNYMQTGR